MSLWQSFDEARFLPAGSVADLLMWPAPLLTIQRVGR